MSAPDAHELILGQSLIRHAAFEFALEKAVEAGVTRIIPVIAGAFQCEGCRTAREMAANHRGGGKAVEAISPADFGGACFLR